MFVTGVAIGVGGGAGHFRIRAARAQIIQPTAFAWIQDTLVQGDFIHAAVEDITWTDVPADGQREGGVHGSAAVTERVHGDIVDLDVDASI